MPLFSRFDLCNNAVAIGGQMEQQRFRDRILKPFLALALCVGIAALASSHTEIVPTCEPGRGEFPEDVSDGKFFEFSDAYGPGEGEPVDDETAQALIDVMSKPADGVNRNEGIPWEGAQLAVRSFTSHGQQRMQIIVENTGFWRGFAFADEDHDSCYEVATVSGWHPEGRAELDAQLSQEVKGYLDTFRAASQ